MSDGLIAFQTVQNMESAQSCFINCSSLMFAFSVGGAASHQSDAIFCICPSSD